MTNYDESYRIIEQAKQQRAEFIGRSIRKHPVVTLLVVGIPILLTQIQWSPSEPVAVEMQDADSYHSTSPLARIEASLQIAESV